VTSEPGVPRGSERVLLVEDEKDVLEAAEAILEGLGYRILTALNGREAMKLYREGQRDIDLVLTDVVMPVMSGPKLCEALLAENPDVKIISMSGYGSRSGLRQIRRLGVRQHVQKPFERSELARTVRQALDE